MASEVIRDELVMAPAGFDPHCHPRAFDALVTNDGQHIDGKAGIREYTRTMLASGYAGGNAMPNESVRVGRIDGRLDDQGYDSQTFPSPISTLEAVLQMEQRIATEAVVDMGIYFGLDPAELYKDEKTPLDREAMRRYFAAVKGRVMGLKVYGEKTEGDYAIRVPDVPDAVEDWQIDHAGEPAVLHLEGRNVGKVLQAVARRSGGKDWAIHIAHVSSRQELEAIIEAKQLGMNVTCEVTAHHLFLMDSDEDLLSGQGCMKPSLKPQKDVDFLWANLEWIDMFGSDCAPHRPGDKQADKPSFGVTNHQLMISLLITEALKPNGQLNLNKLEDMLAVRPRRRFNLPPDDGSQAVFSVGKVKNPGFIENRSGAAYHETPFKTLYTLDPEEAYRRFGVIAFLKHAEAGSSRVNIPFSTNNLREEVLVSGFDRILRPLGKTAADGFTAVA